MTLVELMVAFLIAAILAGLSYGTYRRFGQNITGEVEDANQQETKKHDDQEKRDAQ